MSKNCTSLVLVMAWLLSFHFAGQALAQTVTATMNGTGGPVAVVVNPLTHDSYVASGCGDGQAIV